MSGEIIITDDINWHIQWLQHFDKQIQEGILYPRWLADTNFGYGSPTFVFYPPLIYFVGSFLKFIGFSITQSIAGLYILPTLIAGMGFYVFGKKKWGSIATLTGALFYMTCPYLILNFYVRGALPEAWGMAFIPIGLWLTDQAISSPKWRVLLAFFSATLALTHLPTLLLVTLFWIPYTLFLLRHHSYPSVLMTLAAIVCGWGLVSFYLIPAILEKKLVNLEYMKTVSGGFFNNLIDPVAPQGIRKRPIWQSYIVSLTLFTIMALISSIKNKRRIDEVFYWSTFSLIVLFLTTHWSKLLWATFTTLQMVQFPWRLLGLLSFGVSGILAIAVTGILHQSWKMKISLFLVALVFLSNLRLAKRMISDAPTLNNPRWFANEELRWFKDRIDTAINQPYQSQLIDVREYRPLLPNGELSPAPEIGQPPVSVVAGQAQVDVQQWKSYHRILKVEAQEPSTLRIRTYYYPAWHLYIDSQKSPIKVADDGTIKFELEPGYHTIQLRYKRTKSFNLGIFLSILSLILGTTLFGLYGFKFPM
ncbi:MAG: hypothetical protein ACRCU2_07570 [Planktothrix sp.]